MQYVALRISLIAQHIPDHDTDTTRTESGTTSNVVYDQDSHLWACCYSDDYVDCKTPTEFTFQAPAPQDLKRVVSSSSPSPSAAANSISVISYPTSSSSSSNSLSPLGDDPSPVGSRENDSLGSGAKAGIGVGVAVAALLLIAALLLFWHRRRQQGSTGVTEKPTSIKQNPRGDTFSVQEVDSEQQRELDSRTYFEMNGHARGKNNVQELGSDI